MLQFFLFIYIYIHHRFKKLEKNISQDTCLAQKELRRRHSSSGIPSRGLFLQRLPSVSVRIFTTRGKKSNE